MRILKVIESRHWVNATTGQTASPYGSVPWGSASEESQWALVTRGWTWQNDNGTIGLGRPPAKTYAEAVAVMEANNTRLDDNRKAWEASRAKAARP